MNNALSVFLTPALTKKQLNPIIFNIDPYLLNCEQALLTPVGYLLASGSPGLDLPLEKKMESSLIGKIRETEVWEREYSIFHSL